MKIKSIIYRQRGMHPFGNPIGFVPAASRWGNQIIYRIVSLEYTRNIIFISTWNIQQEFIIIFSRV